jgi:hypothetical protein
MLKIFNIFSRTYTAVDITNSEVRVTSVKGKTFKKWSAAPLPPGLIGNGVIQDPHAVGIVIDNIFSDLKLGRSRVLFTLTGLPFIYGAINMPKLRSATESSSIERAARRELSLAEEDMYLAWQRIPAPVEEGEVAYFVAGVPKNALGSLVQTLEQAHIKPYSIDIKPLTLARVCGSTEAIIVSLEPGYIDIVFVSSGLVRIMHSFSTESQPADKIGLVNEVADGLNKALNSYKRDFPQNTLRSDTPLYITGKYAEDNEILKLMETSSERKVSRLDSPLPLPPELSMDSYAGNIGLLLKKVHVARTTGGYIDTDINLAASLGKKRKSNNLVAYGAGVVVAAGLGAVLFLTITAQANAQDKLNAQNRISTSISSQLTQVQKSNKDLIAAKAAASTDLDSVNKRLSDLKLERAQVANPHLDYSTEIGYITGYVPPGGALDSITMDGKTIVIKGKVMTAYDALNYAVTLDKNAKFAGAKVNDITPATDGTVSFTVLVNQSAQNQ